MVLHYWISCYSSFFVRWTCQNLVKDTSPTMTLLIPGKVEAISSTHEWSVYRVEKFDNLASKFTVGSTSCASTHEYCRAFMFYIIKWINLTDGEKNTYSVNSFNAANLLSFHISLSLHCNLFLCSRGSLGRNENLHPFLSLKPIEVSGIHGFKERIQLFVVSKIPL